MPVNIPDTLPASEVLKKENVFVMHQSRAITQDIRPLRIGILNLMPLKETTETHLIRMLSNTPLQVEIVLLYTKTHTPKHTSIEHLQSFYKSFDDIEHKKLDGLIITGAPIERLPFEQVLYWNELTKILDWADSHVTSTLHICWGAQAALYHYYGIQKFELAEKLFGIFTHTVHDKTEPLVRGFDDEFLAPHSRFTYTRREDIIACKDLFLVSESQEAGVYIAASKNKKHVFVTGHSEYDPLTLREEYVRDLQKGENIAIPKNYFPHDNPKQTPKHRWKSHGNLLFGNWLNYYVYQETPFKLE
ncbi:MAG: homoserine O-succinyltransferase [Bacteroidales bacterium]|nr:homoserine O-succinyltransferase [Bacteroidales bacterium]NLK81305.1 homoserine O-succinyltransferase [Bacteroidales bacterium]